MSVYVISGKDTYRAEAYLRHVLSLKNIDRSHTTVFDGLERKFRLENALMECGSFSLFDDGEAKAVIIRNPSFLMSSGKSSGKETKKKGEVEEYFFGDLQK